MGRSWSSISGSVLGSRCSGCLQGWQHNPCALIIFCESFHEGYGPGIRAVCGLGWGL